jgi:superfamily II DNA or RNA helicase
MDSFRQNQSKAITASIENNFASGVHFHATGTGKSWIALQLAMEFQARHSPCTIFWICEQKSILAEQFDRETIRARGFGKLFSSFLIMDYSQQKPADWVDRVNSASFWKKPILVVVNRAFLTSSQKYESLRIPIHLVIHDECHSITNSTTKAFYTWLQSAHPSARCIGFSATPTLEHNPYTRILSQYTIYDACLDKTIVPPTIAWLKSETHIDDKTVRKTVSSMLNYMPYKKCVVWCGMIDSCFTFAKEWKADPLFANWLVAVDTSDTTLNADFASYEEFQKAPSCALLFCAGKHREGSDIPYLDSCVFLDRVVNRNAKTFIQCIGRVLRKDPTGKKETGLIVDISASSSMRVCDRINAYLNPSGNDALKTFPFQYNFRTLSQILQLHTLKLVPSTSPVKHVATTIPLAHRFVRQVPSDARYTDRLAAEMALFESKNLTQYVHQALDILEIANQAKIPHVTRGSCGSSLVCYLLGISHVDPVRFNIRFARFLNEFRTTLPDIDFDFPHMLRDEIFLQIQMRWPGQVARISNHIHYHKPSAMREAVRRAGFRKQFTAFQLSDFVRKLPLRDRSAVQAEANALENTFRGYSLHCGGIVFFSDGVPNKLKLKTARSATFSQITMNKIDVSKEKQFKIDVLSSRAISQLMDARKFAGLDGEPEFDAHLDDKATAELFSRGDNIGITLAETPLMRKTLLAVKPDSVERIAYCLAIIRPAAKEARKAVTGNQIPRGDNLVRAALNIVYDDDVIDILAKTLHCSDAQADQYRRLISKNDKSSMDELKTLLKSCGKESLLPTLKNVRQYSFCKSHAYSYAQLVWQLGYMKAHYPAAFWKAALKHCESSYRKWVHLYQARLAGVDSDKSSHVSVYAENKRKKNIRMAQTPREKLASCGIWGDNTSKEFFPDCYLRETKHSSYEIRGIIASSRMISFDKDMKRATVFVGIDPTKFIELNVSGKYINPNKAVGITCSNAKESAGVWTAENPVFW